MAAKPWHPSVERFEQRNKRGRQARERRAARVAPQVEHAKPSWHEQDAGFGLDVQAGLFQHPSKRPCARRPVRRHIHTCRL